MDLKTWVRPNIWSLKPYSSARSEFKGEASVFLDANENPYNAPYNRYPDPLQWAVKKRIAAFKGVPAEQIFLGVGSDEPIDLIYRVFCEPAVDNVVAIDPSYGMYQVCADINNVAYKKVQLDSEFQVDAAAVLNAVDERTKAIFLCSPNNPTGNSLDRAAVEKILNTCAGIVVVDEAYIDFSTQPSFLKLLHRFPNLIVLQTFSKAWGSAGVRLGMAFADSRIIEIFNKVKYPYNINRLTQEYALSMLEKADQVKAWVALLLQERSLLAAALERLPVVKKVYPSDANFLLVRVEDASGTYRYLVEKGIIVRNRDNITLCMGCLRITIGTPEENRQLVEAMKNLKTK